MRKLLFLYLMYVKPLVKDFFQRFDDLYALYVTQLRAPFFNISSYLE